MNARPLPGIVDYALLVLLALIWGSAFVFSKIAVTEIEPITITMLRQLQAALLLGLAAALFSRRWFQPTPRDHIFIFASALFGTVLPFTLINWGVAVIDSGMAAILMGLMPLLVLLLAHVLTDDEKLTWPKVAGVFFGLVGLVVLFWPQLVRGIGSDTIRQGAVLGAATAYALNALAVKQLVGRPPLALMAYVSAWTLALLVPAAFILEAPLEIRPSPPVIVSILILGVFASAAGALLMFAIVSRQGASFFGQINLLVPLAGVMLGVVILGERPGWRSLVAMVIIFAGVAVARIRRQTNEKPLPAIPAAVEVEGQDQSGIDR